MVTEDTQKLCCDGEVFWGQLTPLSGAAKQAGCSRRKEMQLDRDGGLLRPDLQHICKELFSGISS